MYSILYIYWEIKKMMLLCEVSEKQYSRSRLFYSLNSNVYSACPSLSYWGLVF